MIKAQEQLGPLERFEALRDKMSSGAEVGGKITEIIAITAIGLLVAAAAFGLGLLLVRWIRRRAAFRSACARTGLSDEERELLSALAG